MLIAASQTVTAEPLRIFLFTNEIPSASVDEQLIARKESLRDLYEILSGAKYQKILTLVRSRDRADASIELLSRGEKTTRASSSSTRAANGGTSSQSQSAAGTKRFLNVRISAGKFTLELLTDGQPKSWRALAEQAAESIAAAIASSDQQIRREKFEQDSALAWIPHGMSVAFVGAARRDCRHRDEAQSVPTGVRSLHGTTAPTARFAVPVCT